MGKQTVDLQRIQMLILDVDGVLTDGGIYIHSDGTESKRFDIQDGHRVKMWKRAGLDLALLSGRESGATTIRAEQLGITRVYQGYKAKLPVYETLLQETGLTPDQTAYVGDDLLDIPLLRRSGFSVAVANAVQEVKQQADYITSHSGGCGAVGEVIEYLLKATGRWEALVERYLQ